MGTEARLEGRSLPFVEDPRCHRTDATDDIDQWLYAFPANLDVHFPCLRILELFNFAQVSTRLEDREAYAHWIPELTKLKSVTTLNILRCEMSANNLTALKSGIDLSRLTSLTSIRLLGYDRAWGQDEEINNIQQILDQLNAPKLRMIAINSCFDKEEEIDMIASVDQFLQIRSSTGWRLFRSSSLLILRW
ncbi:hypothetical protein QCA50_010678 [Cerrena zonata]|uniref:Uncharacterized protein n=1 Tax=Cerrena zonata TaxID=2478898 RepID=A0AAW0G853_9APHY